MAIFRSFSLYLALAGMVLTVFLIKKLNEPVPKNAPFAMPLNPYEQTIAAAGIIESIDKNIELGIPHSAIVKEVHVKVGEKVESGDLLLRLDDRELVAHLLVQKANAAISHTHLLRLKDQLKRLESIEDVRAVSREEINTRRFDVEIAMAQLEASEAEVTHTILMLERLNICAPQKGSILQCNIRKGEFINAGHSSPIILGDTKHLQVRADIDEQNASHLFPKASATAYPKNNSDWKIPLHFERVEPYVIPKRSLTGSSDERVDTRVLQVIYSFEKDPTFPLYVGQQVDIFIEMPELDRINDAEGENKDAI